MFIISQTGPNVPYRDSQQDWHYRKAGQDIFVGTQPSSMKLPLVFAIDVGRSQQAARSSCPAIVMLAGSTRLADGPDSRDRAAAKPCLADGLCREPLAAGRKHSRETTRVRAI